MTPAQLIKWGKKLGEGWQSKLARLMPCNVRTVQYWVTGERIIRPMIWARIKQVIREELMRRALKLNEKSKPTDNPTETQRVIGEPPPPPAPPPPRFIREGIKALNEKERKAWNEAQRAPVGSLLKPTKK